MLDNPRKDNWAGYTYEQLVKDHIEPLKKALGFSSVLTQLSTWYSSGQDGAPGAQIDLLIDRRDRTINICEIKYYSSEFTIGKDYSMKLRNKLTAFKDATKTKKSLALTIVTTFGLKANMYSPMIQAEATLDDLFNQ